MPVRALAFLVAAFFLIAPARAHTTDTSYARVRIFDDRLEIRLTLDIFTLQRIVPDIDANGDSALSREELRRATPAIQKFLREHVGIEVNEAASELGVAKDPFWPLDAPDPIPASAWHTNEALVSFGFDKPLASKPKTVALLFGVFGTLGDRHGVLGVFDDAEYVLGVHGLPRDDAAAALNMPRARRCGFTLRMPTQRMRPGTHTVDVAVVAADGTSYLTHRVANLELTI